MIAKISILIVSLIHFLFVYMQMFFWQTEQGAKSLKLDLAHAKPFQTLALQQGLYNGFLAVGLLLSLFLKEEMMRKYGVSFFLSCMLIAGIVGGLTASNRILFMQALPALIALVFVWI